MLVGLLAVSFAIPATIADTKPSWALNSDDVEGWWIYNEGSLFDWNYTVGAYSFDIQISAWYQIWINNETAKSTPEEAWLNATAAMCLVVMQFNDDLDDFTIDLGWIKVDINLWNLLKISFNATGTQKSVAGLDDAYVWSNGNVWAGVGYSGKLLIWAMGYGDQTSPANPFGGLSVSLKDVGPSDTGATESDVLTLMGAQGSSFGGGIPGFGLASIFMSLVLLVGVFFIFRKDQLHMIKKY